MIERPALHGTQVRGRVSGAAPRVVAPQLEVQVHQVAAVERVAADGAERWPAVTTWPAATDPTRAVDDEPQRRRRDGGGLRHMQDRRVARWGRHATGLGARNPQLHGARVPARRPDRSSRRRVRARRGRVGDAGESLWGEGDQPPTRIHERQRTGARPLNPCMVKGHIPPEIGAAVASALAYNPAERWPTVLQDMSG